MPLAHTDITPGLSSPHDSPGFFMSGSVWHQYVTAHRIQHDSWHLSAHDSKYMPSGNTALNAYLCVSVSKIF